MHLHSSHCGQYISYKYKSVAVLNSSNRHLHFCKNYSFNICWKTLPLPSSSIVCLTSTFQFDSMYILWKRDFKVSVYGYGVTVQSMQWQGYRPTAMESCPHSQQEQEIFCIPVSSLFSLNEDGRVGGPTIWKLNYFWTLNSITYSMLRNM
jgi:hypothetical protein